MKSPSAWTEGGEHRSSLEGMELLGGATVERQRSDTATDPDAVSVSASDLLPEFVPRLVRVMGWHPGSRGRVWVQSAGREA